MVVKINCLVWQLWEDSVAGEVDRSGGGGLCGGDVQVIVAAGAGWACRWAMY